MRKIGFWPAVMLGFFMVSGAALAEGVSKRSSSGSSSSAEDSGTKKTKKKSTRRSFKEREDADTSRPAPTTTENALTAEPNIPGADPDPGTIARRPGERPSTD